jgi:hypothetical protein
MAVLLEHFLGRDLGECAEDLSMCQPCAAPLNLIHASCMRLAAGVTEGKAILWNVRGGAQEEGVTGFRCSVGGHSRHNGRHPSWVPVPNHDGGHARPRASDRRPLVRTSGHRGVAAGSSASDFARDQPAARVHSPRAKRRPEVSHQHIASHRLERNPPRYPRTPPHSPHFFLFFCFTPDRVMFAGCV